MILLDGIDLLSLPIKTGVFAAEETLGTDNEELLLLEFELSISAVITVLGFEPKNNGLDTVAVTECGTLTTSCSSKSSVCFSWILMSIILCGSFGIGSFNESLR